MLPSKVLSCFRIKIRETFPNGHGHLIEYYSSAAYTFLRECSDVVTICKYYISICSSWTWIQFNSCWTYIHIYIYIYICAEYGNFKINSSRDDIARSFFSSENIAWLLRQVLLQVFIARFLSKATVHGRVEQAIDEPFPRLLE